MKDCRTCRATKSLDYFYRHAQMADGHLNICKDCIKSNVKMRRVENADKVQEYDRKRSLLPHRKDGVRARAHRYKHIPRPEKDPAKRKARIATRTAIRNGNLKKKPCEKCGSEDSPHARHEDYSKPLDVTWLCPPCHGARHREINEDRRKTRANP